MIVFVGAEDRGYWVRETAQIRGEELEFVESSMTIHEQINEILRHSGDYIIFDIEQYVDNAEALAEEIMQIGRAKSWTVVIYAPGYDRESRIVQQLMYQGIRYFVYSGNFAEAREELERCLNGYYREPKEEELQEVAKREEAKNGIRIGVAGACHRMGTTTFALQLVKYLQLKGYKACYVEVNATGFVEQHERTFNTVHDTYLGKVTFENVEMYYRQEKLLDVLKQEYDYFVYDFGTYMDTDFSKTSFLEKDVRIFVVGSKASEMSYTNELIRNEYYTDVNYVFNFISEKEKPELLEYMEEKAAQTYFTVSTPDQFEYVPNEAFEKLLPVEDISEPEEEPRGFFRKKKGRKGETVWGNLRRPLSVQRKQIWRRSRNKNASGRSTM